MTVHRMITGQRCKTGNAEQKLTTRHGLADPASDLRCVLNLFGRNGLFIPGQLQGIQALSDTNCQRNVEEAVTIHHERGAWPDCFPHGDHCVNPVLHGGIDDCLRGS
jgi:hypothetical protein